jgi:sugar O-acyltransferase (sialic acid O-acetyltransferase NeuD family)
MYLALYGAGGLGREIWELSKKINSAKSIWDDILFVDDRAHELTVNGMKIFTYKEVILRYPLDEIKFSIAVGEPTNRAKLAEKITSDGYELETLVYPEAYVSPSVSLGKGAIVCAGCFISCGAIIGDNVLCQPICAIGHDVSIGADAVISSFVSLGGNSKVGRRTFIGMSAAVKEDVKIGDDVILAMGSMVFSDVDDGLILVGNPARPMKRNIERKVFK